ncbi:MAG TPA: PAS domain-containing protein [Roseomonas sp.]|nr:PAS domain-containing protein [Roseomonas sp.]
MLDEGVAVELVLDVTDRKATEQALRESEAKLRSLVEGIPQLVFRSRSSGERIWGSPQWVSYTGLSEEASLGLGWLDAIHPDDRAATMAAWAETKARGLFSVEHRTYRAADGTWRCLQSHATPMRDAQGRILEWFGTSTDIDDQVRAREVLTRGREELEAQVAERTADLRHALDSLQAEMAQRERAEAALRQMQKMEAVGQLTGGIAHNFNNMLQGIVGSLDMARRRAAEGRIADVLRYLEPARQFSRAGGRADPAVAGIRAAAAAGAKASGPGRARGGDGGSDPPDSRTGGPPGAASARRPGAGAVRPKRAGEQGHRL